MSTPCVATPHTRFLDLLNGLRQRNGLPPLEADAELHAAATFRAEDMVARNYFSHETPGRGSAREVIEQHGYDGDLTGENICWGEKTAEEAFDTWVTSPDHFENMVSPNYTAIGIGGPIGVQFQDEKWGLWVTTFGSALGDRAGSCGVDAGVDPVRPDRPPRRVRLSRERPPREERHRRRDDDRDRGRGRDNGDERGERDRDRDREREREREEPAPVRRGALSGPIVTPAPWGSFGIGWEQINRWDDAIERAAAEFGVPAERIKAHIVIESGGDPDAVQQNEQNGWSFGLMQVVPRWWRDLILQLAGRPDSGQSEREVGQLLLDDPNLAVRAGTGVLKAIYDGDWDRTSSKFFLGNPDWVGADTVNGNSGLQYKAMLNGLIAEITMAGQIESIKSGPAPAALEQAAGPIHFGRVPHPAFTDRLIEDRFNRAWDDLGQRRVKGIVLHRQQGPNWGTDNYFRSAPPGGLSACPEDPNDPTYYNWGGCRALTDYGVDHVTGETLRWNDPSGAARPGISPNRAGWASGKYLGAYGDGLAFVQDHGGDRDVVNRDQASIEISGTYHEPIFGYGTEQPVSEACRDQVAAIIAYWADQFGISYDRFPWAPGKDYRFVRWHHEFTKGTGKYCPGETIMNLTNDVYARTTAILKAHQTDAVEAPRPEAVSVAEDPSMAPAGAVAAGGLADCPVDYPIKGNASSHIYHVPGGGSYNRTIPEICFATAAGAEAAGYHAARN